MIRKNKIWSVLFFTGILVLIIRIFLPIKKSNSEIRDDFWIKKTHQKTKNNFVVGGNSRIYRGVSVSAIKGALFKNLSGVNLGYSALGYSADYLTFLESRLDLEAKHKIIILGIDPGSLTKIAAKNESFNRYAKINYSEVFKTLYINQYVGISVYKPTEIFNLFKRNQENTDFIEDRKNYFARYDDNGWVASYKLPNNPDEALPIYKKFAEENKMSIDQEVLNGLFLKIEEFVNNEIIVLAFRPPSTKPMQDWENQYYNFNEQQIQAKIEQLGGHWLEINTENYNSYDGAHLHYQSAEKLSIEIAEKIEGLISEK